MSRKPADEEEDPELVKEIQFARRNLGQFTRKVSDKYEDTRPIRVDEQKKKLIDLLMKVGRAKKRKILIQQTFKKLASFFFFCLSSSKSCLLIII